MATSIKDISAKIADMLEALVDTSNPPVRLIPTVREHAEGNKSDYPLAEILPTGGSTVKRIDSARNERIIIFDINIWQEQSEAGKSPADSTADMIELCDAIITAFDTDKDLSDLVENSNLSKMTFDFIAKAGPWIAATFSLECVIVTPSI